MMRRESRLPDDWFAKAKKEMRRVQVLLADGDTEGAGFHLQQAAEKYLKGYLLGRGWPLIRTHDLEVLLNEALTYDERFEEYLDAGIVVREFYVEMRYPFITSPPPARQGLETVLGAMEEMIALILAETD